MPPFFGHCFFYLTATARAKFSSSTQPGTALGAGESDSPLQVLNSHYALVEINIAYTNSQSLRDAAAKVKQQPDKELVSQVYCCVLKLFYFDWFEVCF